LLPKRTLLFSGMAVPQLEGAIHESPMGRPTRWFPLAEISSARPTLKSCPGMISLRCGQAFFQESGKESGKGVANSIFLW
jgi:hypothetical protein